MYTAALHAAPVSMLTGQTDKRRDEQRQIVAVRFLVDAVGGHCNKTKLCGV